jgi:hypothetical protein
MPVDDKRRDSKVVFAADWSIVFEHVVTFDSPGYAKCILHRRSNGLHPGRSYESRSGTAYCTGLSRRNNDTDRITTTERNKVRVIKPRIDVNTVGVRSI